MAVLITAIVLVCLNHTNIIQLLNIQKVENFEENEYEISEDKNLESTIDLQNTETQTDNEEEQEKIIECESIMQGINDIKEENGYYTLRVKGQIDGVEEIVDYPIELLNFHEDIIYTASQQLGDDIADRKSVV